jgi:hypothetical protein
MYRIRIFGAKKKAPLSIQLNSCKRYIAIHKNRFGFILFHILNTGWAATCKCMRRDGKKGEVL